MPSSELPTALAPSPLLAAAQHALMEEEISAKKSEKAKLAAQLAELKGQSVSQPLPR